MCLSTFSLRTDQHLVAHAPRVLGLARIVVRPPFGHAPLPLMAALLALVCSLYGAPVMAQATAADRAAAEALFDQGVKLLEAGNAEQACPKLEESQRLDPGIGTLLYLADCYQQVGRTASAWATFREAAYAAKAAGQDDRERIANELAEKLRPKLSYVSLKVQAAETEGLEIYRDGQLIRRALWATPVPVDPGPHRFEARAPGRVTWTQEQQIPGGPANTEVEIPELAVDTSQVAPPAAEAPPPAAAPQSAAPQTRPPLSQSSVGTTATPEDLHTSGRQQRLYGWVSVAVGGAALLTSTVLSVMAVSDNDAANNECLPNDPTLCNELGIELAQSAGDKATLATISGGLGLAGVAAGAILILTAPTDGATATRIAPGLTHESAAIYVTGAF